VGIAEKYNKKWQNVEVHMSRKIIVPFDDRGTVEKLGALKMKHPYYSVPEYIDMSKFEYWDRPDLNPDIMGEDRTHGNNMLYVDLIPKQSWYKSVRENIDSVDWERIKEMCKKRANFRCELCGSSPNYELKNYLECHERFSFDKDNCVQKLVRFVCLCTKCHYVTHWGLSAIEGRLDIARTHMMEVNKWDEERVSVHVKNRFEKWKIKNEITWEIDLSMLENMGIEQTTSVRTNLPH